MKSKIENTNVRSWLDALARDKPAGASPLMRRVRLLVSKPKRQRVSVNLYKLDMHVKQGETAVVPGKVLSGGEVSHAFDVAAMEFSDAARKKLLDKGCKIIDVSDLNERKNLRLIV